MKLGAEDQNEHGIAARLEQPAPARRPGDIAAQSTRQSLSRAYDWAQSEFEASETEVQLRGHPELCGERHETLSSTDDDDDADAAADDDV